MQPGYMPCFSTNENPGLQHAPEAGNKITVEADEVLSFDDLDKFDLEGEGLSGERMVRVKCHRGVG